MTDTPRKDNARRQPGGVGKAKAIQLTFSFSNASPVKPRDPDGQAGQVLHLIREHGPVLSLELTANRAIPEAAARVHDLRAMGFNIITTILPRVEFRGVERRNVALYSLASPEWFSPVGGR